MGKRKIRSYTEEFKGQSVELANRIGMSRAAKQLGVHVANIHYWKSKGKNKGTKPIKQESLEEENRRLRKENQELSKVNEILKRAAAFFSQDHLK